jgi:excisionase family DNA binding protein
MAEPSRSAPPPVLLSVPEAGEALNLSRAQVDREIAAGRLASVKCGRRRLVPREGLTEFIDALRQAAS